MGTKYSRISYNEKNPKYLVFRFRTFGEYFVTEAQCFESARIRVNFVSRTWVRIRSAEPDPCQLLAS
jgi:hypothetical protein